MTERERPGAMFNYREPEREQSDEERERLAKLRKYAGTNFVEPTSPESTSKVEDLPEFKKIESGMMRMLLYSGLGPMGSRQTFATRVAHYILERDAQRDAEKNPPEESTPKPEDFGYKQLLMSFDQQN